MVDPALLARLVKTGSVVCFLCHEKIQPDDEWAIGFDKRGDDRPMHRECDG